MSLDELDKRAWRMDEEFGIKGQNLDRKAESGKARMDP